MHVCFIALEYFAWGKYGGIGKATRDIASELVKRGEQVSAVVPLGSGQSRCENIDGVDVYGFPMAEYPLIGGLLRRIEADIYHSQDLSLGTWLAKKACLGAHLLTCQNPKTSEDWEKVNRFYPLRRRIYNTVVDPRVRQCVKNLNHVYCQAKYTIEKTRDMYGLDYSPTFLPNPVKVPSKIPEKTEIPKVLFLGRFDGEKDPECFMRLAKEFHDVNFIAAGASHDPLSDERIRSKYSGVNNLSLPGFINGNEKEKMLSESWILVNTSVSECLPVSFLEAAAHGCSILSPHDPDGFASSFGFHISKHDLYTGLKQLLEDDAWRKKGTLGYDYVKKTHEIQHVIDLHLKEYKKRGS
ncbi:MAG: glycosyltransferase family 4 protein [Candidatus Bathyarchaeota archaeon]|nr:glycosyltransferase family 4 protein [Candidatus Bathyarchaeota archaeon]